MKKIVLKSEISSSALIDENKFDIISVNKFVGRLFMKKFPVSLFW